MLEFTVQESELFMVSETPYLDNYMDLGSYHFAFAIMDLDPSVGRVLVELVNDPVDGDYSSIELEMIACETKYTS